MALEFSVSVSLYIVITTFFIIVLKYFFGSKNSSSIKFFILADLIFFVNIALDKILYLFPLQFFRVDILNFVVQPLAVLINSIAWLVIIIGSIFLIKEIFE